MKEIGYVNMAQTVHKGVVRNLRSVRYPERHQGVVSVESRKESFAAGLVFVAFAAILLLFPLIPILLGD